MGVAAWRHAGKPKKPQVFCCFHFTTAWRSRIIKLTRKESKHFPFVLFVRAEAVQCQALGISFQTIHVQGRIRCLQKSSA